MNIDEDNEVVYIYKSLSAERSVTQHHDNDTLHMLTTWLQTQICTQKWT